MGIYTEKRLSVNGFLLLNSFSVFFKSHHCSLDSRSTGPPLWPHAPLLLLLLLLLLPTSTTTSDLPSHVVGAAQDDLHHPGEAGEAAEQVHSAAPRLLGTPAAVTAAAELGGHSQEDHHAQDDEQGNGGIDTVE